MKFVKNRDGFNAQGNSDARFIADSRVPYLSRRRPAMGNQPATVATKKLGFLEVTFEQAASVVTAFLWSLMARTTGNLLYRRIGTTPTRKDVDFDNPLRSPGGFPNGHEIYVGGGYILALTHDNGTGNGNDPCACWISLINANSGATEVLSLSEDNKPGANVSFADVVNLPSRPRYWYNAIGAGATTLTERPSIFVTGWDAAAGGYGFGIIGRRLLTDQGPESYYAAGDLTPFDLVCFYGNTATRKVTRVDLPGSADLMFSRYYRVCTVGNGKLMALVHPYHEVPTTGGPGTMQLAPLAYPNPPKFLRSNDHGRTWYTEAVPELVPHLYRLAGPPVSYATGTLLSTDADTCAPQFFHASPIGGGRIAMVVLGGRDYDHAYTTAEFAAARPIEYSDGNGGRLAYFTRWRFFVSDETGRNFVNKPWPADDWDGYPRANITAVAAGTWMAPMIATSFAPQRFENAISTAGPGTFFLSVGEQQSLGNVTSDNYPKRWRMLYTLDYGSTWAISPYLPTEAVNDRPVATPIVARPYRSADDKGEAYTIALEGTTVRVFKSDLTFSSMTKVYEKVVPDYYAYPTQSRINAVFTGSTAAATDGRYTGRTFPGYSEFNKP